MSADAAVDTSAAVPFVVRNHAAHRVVVNAIGDRSVALSGHALFETYSVLTRLPSGVRLAPHDALALLRDRFAEPLVLGAHEQRAALEVAVAHGIAGGAVYDVLVGAAARSAGLSLLTRDRRALGTYAALDVEPLLIPDKGES